MIKRVSEYVSTGMNESKTALKSSKIPRFQLLLFILSTFIGKLFFLSAPLFMMAEYRLVKQVQETHRIRLEDAFADSHRSSVYKTMTLAVLWNQIVIFSGLLLLGLLTFGLSIVAQQFSSYVFPFDWSGLAYTIGILLGVGFVITIFLWFDPMIFLIHTQENYGLSDAMKKAEEMMTNTGMFKLIMIRLHHLFLILVFAGGGAWLALYAYFSYSVVWFLVFLIPIVLIVFAKVPQILLSQRMACTMLYDDLVEESTYQSLYDQSFKGLDSEKIGKERLLVALFDELPTSTLEDDPDKWSLTEER
jgi:hypothetical protein